MSRKTNDVSQAPNAPQFQMGATVSEAKLEAEIGQSPIPDPGGIVDRLGYQFQLPRAATDSEISRDGHGTQNG